MSEWVADVLQEEFEQLTLPFGEGEDGEIVATLVRALPPAYTVWQRLSGKTRLLDDVDVLYVHGWSDYFFNKRLARFWTSRGARFFALDLRRYGRSLREGNTPGYVDHLDEYDEDIAAALAEMGHAPKKKHASRRLVLLGHSTGGLTLTLWAHRHPGIADALVLNAPWLEFQLNRFWREAISPILSLQAKRRAREAAPQLDTGFYARAQAEVVVDDDLMEVNLDWRPEKSTPVTAGWLKAVIEGHALVAGGLAIDAPVCVMISARSVVPVKWSDELTAADTVLFVDDVARAALGIAPSVTIERIDGALHDIFLSRREARDEAYRRLDRWITGWAASSIRTQ